MEVARIALSTLCLPSLVYEWSKANVAKQLIISAMMRGSLPGCCASSPSSVPNALQVARPPILRPSFTLTRFPSNAAGPSSLFQPPISNLPVESPPSTVSQQVANDPYHMRKLSTARTGTTSDAA